LAELKRRYVAKLVEGTRRKTRPGRLQVIAVRKTRRGIIVLEEITDCWNPKEKWKPVLKRAAKHA
jgi:hypothetical protein